LHIDAKPNEPEQVIRVHTTVTMTKYGAFRTIPMSVKDKESYC